MHLRLAATGTLVGLGLVVAWMGQRADAAAQARPRLCCTRPAAANTVTIRLAPGNSPLGRKVLARSRIVVSEGGKTLLSRASPGHGVGRVPVAPGTQNHV